MAFLGFLNSSSAAPGIAAHELTGLETGDLYQNGVSSPGFSSLPPVRLRRCVPITALKQLILYPYTYFCEQSHQVASRFRKEKCGI